MNGFLEAACYSVCGALREKNEDNAFFNADCLELARSDMDRPIRMCRKLSEAVCVAVFDGMSGEKYGDFAACTAAEALCRHWDEPHVNPGGDKRMWIEGCCRAMNAAVLEAGRAFKTSHIGATVAGLFLEGNTAAAFNLGDSRVYLLRGGELKQLSYDHTERYYPPPYRRKPPLSQYLGVEEEEFLLEPHIAEETTVGDDMFLLCTDGLTDALQDEDIRRLLTAYREPERCVEALVQGATEMGSRDNITVIVGRIRQAPQGIDGAEGTRGEK